MGWRGPWPAPMRQLPPMQCRVLRPGAGWEPSRRQAAWRHQQSLDLGREPGLQTYVNACVLQRLMHLMPKPVNKANLQQTAESVS